VSGVAVSGGMSLKRKLIPWGFLAPFALIFGTFTVYPLFYSIYLATRRTVGVVVDVPVGASNFIDVFTDELFWMAMLRTGYFAVMSLLIQLPVALGLALIVNQKTLIGRGFFRTVFFMPVLVGQVFIGIAFERLLGWNDGVLNKIVDFFDEATFGLFIQGGLYDPVNWLGNPDVVMTTLVFVGVWIFAGFNMIYFLAALQGIPEELYQAASIDGANTWQRFVNVTVPGIWPVAAFLITASTIGSFGLFDLPWVLTERGGPGDASTTVMVYLYKKGFLAGDIGYASAMGWVVTGILLIIALVQLKLSRAWSD
jgi:ABC-type sugar transport system permease subunit